MSLPGDDHDGLTTRGRPPLDPSTVLRVSDAGEGNHRELRVREDRIHQLLIAQGELGNATPSEGRMCPKTNLRAVCLSAFIFRVGNTDPAMKSEISMNKRVKPYRRDYALALDSSGLNGFVQELG